ncbi:MAG: N-acyl-D-amino-acid deacylase family protein [Acidobacteriaceae bacterium]
MPNEMILLKNATVIDGSGAVPHSGDILIAGKRIAAVGHCESPADVRTLDCTGLVAAPGFIDAHSHSDLQVLEGRLEKTRQGVTAEIVGNCGFSPYPMARHAHAVHQFANGILCGDEHWGWTGASAYLDALAKAPTANVYSLIGHGSMRVEVAGNEQRPLTAQEMDRMEHLLDEALAAGAIGFSTGLMYAPGSCAPLEELERLCRVVARHGKVYATHMRSYSFGLEDAVEEQLHLARRTGCRLQISHLQAVGRSNWNRQERVLQNIEDAVQQGVDVAFDCYPYTAGNTTLTQLVPQWSLDGGLDKLIERLLDPALRKRIVDESRAAMALPWTDVILTSVESQQNQQFVGMSLAAIAEQRAQDPGELLLDLLIEERGAATMLTFNQSEENMRRILTHPLSIIITDGLFVRGKAHPRLHGTFPFLLGELCRHQGWLTLQNAIHKITGKPAERFGIPERGLLKPGYFADLTLFDASAIDSKANYDTPDVSPVGIRHVLRNGEFIASIEQTA